MTQQEIHALTDRQLHVLCSTCGANIRKLQKEFAGYLCEVAARQLYKRYGFYSLYEYAAKLAGMSHAVVDEIMSIHKRLEDKPVLKDLIAEQGWTKLKIVAGAATPQNQGFWAEKVKEMSKSALAMYVKELRKQGQAAGVQAGARPAGSETAAQTELFTDPVNVPAFSPGISKPMAESQKSAIAFKLDSDTETKLRIFKQRYEKQTCEPQDWNNVMKKLLQIAEEHGLCGKPEEHRLCGKLAGRAGGKKTGSAAYKPQNGYLGRAEKTMPTIPSAVPKRYIPAGVKKYLVRKFEGKCAYPTCKKSVRNFPSHAPLCAFPKP